MDLCDFGFKKFDFGGSGSSKGSSGNAWMYPRNSMLKPIFDRAMLEMDETGILDQIIDKYLSNADELCHNNELIQIDFSFVAIGFVVLGAGVGLSMIVMAIEKIFIHLRSQ